MFNLRDLTWPHFAPSKQPSSSSKSVPNSKATSVNGLVLKPDTNRSLRRSSEGTAQSNLVDSQNTTPAMVTQQAKTLPPTIQEVDEMNSTPSSTGLFSPVDSEEKDGKQIKADSIGDDLGESPASIADFQFGSRESFNTTVRDLIQQAPDMPIGGQEASSMEPVSPNLTVNSKEYPPAPQSTPRIESSSPTIFSLKVSPPAQRPILHSRSNRSHFSDPFISNSSEHAKIEHLATILTAPPTPLASAHATPMFTASATPMFTAPETPQHGRAVNFSEVSHDGPRDSEAKDFANTDKLGLPLPDCCVSPTSTAQDEADSGLVPGVDDLPPLADSSNIPTAISTTEIVDSPTDPADVTDLITTAIPTDVTGLDAVPEIPLPNSAALKLPKSKKSKDKVKKCYRMGRRCFLRKGVLVLIVGRDLAGPTKEILRMASKTCGPISSAVSPATSATTAIPGPVSV